ncbi:MAG: DUF4258 domain-containing protein [Candidatus Omnitrophica bacterium]|nr:DUF4258 domain-containing protein [Candidatus Omnitrophota bacterium]
MTGVVIATLVLQAAKKKLLFLSHAVRQMSLPDRMIRPVEVRRVVEKGEVIEDYPNDPRGHSCLMLGEGEGGRKIHVVCSPKIDFLAIITAYLPTNFEWGNSYRIRRKKI